MTNNEPMIVDILLLASTPMEWAEVRHAVQRPCEKVVSGRTWIYGCLGKYKVLLIQTGIGAVNTAHAVTCALERHRPTLVMQFGVGGAYLTSGLDPGDVALATEEIYGDLGVMAPDGWHSAELIGIPILEKEGQEHRGWKEGAGNAGKKDNTIYYNRFPLDSARVASVYDMLSNMKWDSTEPVVRQGPFVTVQQCSGTTTLGNKIAGRFDGICENMEGAAAAHLCTLYNIPFIEIRSVSNRVEDRNTSAWNLPLAIRRAQQAVIEVTGAIKL